MIKNKILHTATIVTATLLIICAECSIAAAIQELTDGEMNNVTGQAGVSIFITTTMISHNPSTFIIYDTKGGSIEFTPFNTTLVAATRNKTLDLDIMYYNDFYDTDTTFTDLWPGGSTTYTIQHPLNDHVFINASIENMNLTLNSSIGNVLFNGVSLGPVELTNMRISDVDLNIFQYNGMGIDAALKTRFTVEQFAYTYDNDSTIGRKERLEMNNITVAGSFGGPALPSYKSTVNPGGAINTAAWTQQGYFELGDMQPAWSSTFIDDPGLEQSSQIPTASVNSLSIDLKEDTSPFIRRQYIIDWQGNYNPDPDGLLGDGSVEKPHIANTRQDEVYIEVGLPTKGSIRFETSTRSFTGGPPTTVSYGPSAIDGIRGYSRIEVPGHGIGNSPTTSKLYE